MTNMADLPNASRIYPVHDSDILLLANQIVGITFISILFSLFVFYVLRELFEMSFFYFQVRARVYLKLRQFRRSRKLLTRACVDEKELEGKSHD